MSDKNGKRKRGRPSKGERVAVTVRPRPVDHDAIARAAKSRGLTINDFMLRAALAAANLQIEIPIQADN
jgi:uncharacterized protein (DUF1778 family)